MLQAGEDFGEPARALLTPLPQVFQVQVRCGGRRHTLPRRYSEFHALHKRVRCPMTLGEGHPGLYLPQAWTCMQVPGFGAGAGGRRAPPHTHTFQWLGICRVHLI